MARNCKKFSWAIRNRSLFRNRICVFRYN